jgi:hypothetical protein
MFGVDDGEVDCWLAVLKWGCFEHLLEMLYVHVSIGQLALVLLGKSCDLLLVLLSDGKGTLLMVSSSLPWRAYASVILRRNCLFSLPIRPSLSPYVTFSTKGSFSSFTPFICNTLEGLSFWVTRINEY